MEVVRREEMPLSRETLDSVFAERERPRLGKVSWEAFPLTNRVCEPGIETGGETDFAEMSESSSSEIPKPGLGVFRGKE